MGGGGYSTHSRMLRAMTDGYYTKLANEIFKQREIHLEMSPKGIMVRESRDSEEHPESIPIIVALDVTGSMGRIPHDFVRDGLPTLVSTLIEAGIKHPQILFLAIGDHLRDRAPLQVGQFESSDELLDKWLTSVYIEQGGGGNNGESYTLAHYFAGYHTVHDHFEKRGKKGFLFTIGDEHAHREISTHTIKEIMGGGEPTTGKATDLIAKAQEKYDVYHLHVMEGSNGLDPAIARGWKELLKENCLEVEDYRKIPQLIAETVISRTKNQPAISGTASETSKKEEPKKDDSNWAGGGSIL